MRKKLLVICGLFALVGTIAVAAVLGIAGVGKAASKNTCTQPTGQPPDCLTVKVFPGQLTAGAGHQGLIVAKFINQGSATATHTVIKVTLPHQGDPSAADNVTAVSVSPQALCSPLFGPPVQAAIITCSFGNVAGGGTAKVSIAFTTTVAKGLKLLGETIEATLTYAEGNDNNGSPTNDSFNAFGGNDISLVDGTSLGGDCASSNVNGPLISTSKDGQFTYVDSLTSFLTDLACTPIAAGTLTNPPNLTCGGTHKCTTPLSFAILPTTGQATLYIPVSSLANGTKAAGPNKFTLYWFPEGGIVGTPLMTCAETLDKATPPDTDTCIVSQTDTKIGKDQYIKDVLKIFGVGTSLADSGFAG